MFLLKKEKTIHLLHIGKTGGTSLTSAFKDLQTPKYNFLTHFGHDHSFKEVPKNELVVFFLRNPLTRFVSGFYSRKRKGQPRYNVPWSAEEELAFNHFETPDALGTALSSANEQEKETAIEAMKGIGHVNTHFKDWLINIDYLKTRQKDIFYIGFQETFDSDFRGLYKKLTRLELETEILKEHVNPPGDDKNLSDKARMNLEQWFKNDIELYIYCSQIAKEVNL